MRVTLNYLILSLYFFVYITPQYITNIYIAFDRVYPQMFAISIINIFSFIYIYKNYKIKDFLSNFEHKNHLISYLLFIVISTMSLVVANNFVEGVVSLIKLFNFFVAFMVIIIITSAKKLKFLNYFILVTLISLFIESVIINLSVIDSVIINGNLLERSNTYAGFGANINIASFSVLIKSIVPIYLFFNSKNNLVRIISAIFIFSSVLTILLLMSRAAVLSIVLVYVSILLITIISNKVKYYQKFSLMTFVLLISVLSYNVVNEKNAYNILTERFSNVTNPVVDDSVNERLNFYTTAVKSIFENPLLGIGIGNWKIKSIDLSKDIIESYRVPYFAHNDFLQFTAEIGIIGGGAFIFYIFYPFILSFLRGLKSKSFNIDVMIFLIFLIYIIDSMLNFPIERPINFIYLCFTFALFYQSKKYSLK